MSMITTFRRLSDEDLERLCDEPGVVEDYLGAEEPIEGFGPFAELDVDKAWHAIHFMLTGSAWEGDPPLNFIVSGGTEIGEDMGYGPARGLLNMEVRNVAAALQLLPTAVLMRRFDRAAFAAAEIYPPIWGRSLEEDDTRGYVAENYEALRAFVIDAATAGEGLLIAVR